MSELILARNVALHTLYSSPRTHAQATSKQKEKVHSNLQEISDQFPVKHLFKTDADEKMNEWTTDKLGNHFVKLVGARFQKYVFGPDDVDVFDLENVHRFRDLERKSEVTLMHSNFHSYALCMHVSYRRRS